MKIACSAALAAITFAAAMPAQAKLAYEPSTSRPAVAGQFQEARCMPGKVYMSAAVVPIYGTRGGRTGVIDVMYIDAGCYYEF